MRIMITGAGGFIGQHLCKHLHAHGHDVRALHRPPHTLESGNAQRASGEIQFLNIGQDTDWKGILDGMEVIIHLADGLRRFEMPGPAVDCKGPEAQKALQITAGLARAARESRISRLIYLGSIKAICGESADGIVKDDTPPQNNRGCYGHLKRQLEDILLQASTGSDMQVAVLRPPLVFGPGSRGNFSKLLKLADTPWPLPFAGFKAKRSLIYVENLCDAIRVVLESPQPCTGTWLVQDDFPASVCEIVKTVRAATGRSARLLPFPGLSRLRQFKTFKPVLERLSAPMILDDSPFRKTFSWHPPCERHVALTATLQALQAEKQI